MMVMLIQYIIYIGKVLKICLHFPIFMLNLLDYICKIIFKVSINSNSKACVFLGFQNDIGLIHFNFSDIK